MVDDEADYVKNNSKKQHCCFWLLNCLRFKFVKFISGFPDFGRARGIECAA